MTRPTMSKLLCEAVDWGIDSMDAMVDAHTVQWSVDGKHKVVMKESRKYITELNVKIKRLKEYRNKRWGKVY